MKLILKLIIYDLQIVYKIIIWKKIQILSMIIQIMHTNMMTLMKTKNKKTNYNF